MSAETLAAIEQALATVADADEALRAVVGTLVTEPGVSWAGIAFVEEGELVLGPSAGTPDATRRNLATVRYGGSVVGELWIDGDTDSALIEAVADRISAHVLLGWDTGGAAWEP
jgi:putative methionine-R-sulfoxide reductase with GAF domain